MGLLLFLNVRWKNPMLNNVKNQLSHTEFWTNFTNSWLLNHNLLSKFWIFQSVNLRFKLIGKYQPMKKSVKKSEWGRFRRHGNRWSTRTSNHPLSRCLPETGMQGLPRRWHCQHELCLMGDFGLEYFKHSCWGDRGLFLFFCELMLHKKWRQRRKAWRIQRVSMC